MGTKFWWTVFASFVGVSTWIISLHFWRITRKRAPPGSIGWPLLGETLLFLKPHPSTSTGQFLHHRVQRFGRVFKSHLFGEPAIVSCDPDLNAYVLQNEDRLFQCSYPTAIHGILGEMSMLVVVGDAHKRLRTLALSLVNAAKTNPTFLHDIETNALLITGKWKQKQTVIFCEEARKFTFNVIVKQILSLEPDSPETSTILKDFLTFMKGLASLPLYIPGTSYAKAVKSKSQILSTLKTLVDRRRNGEETHGGDFLDMLLTSTSLADDEILSLVLDLLLGGYETTAVLIAMVLKFLTDCPSALQLLKSEHEDILRRKQNDKAGLNWDDYKQMSFTQNVINEALRCGNVVKFVHRKALKDVKFKGYEIPAGWKILPMFSAVHLDSSSYEDPQEFNPWRWQTAIAGKQFTPFGGGPRLCPGSELAKVETAFFIHHLVLNFRWRPAELDHSVAYPYVEFEKGLPIHVERLYMAN